ncbi:hypothetical protein GWN42_19325 [candidate division KSB1 bacterium]|nr:hypothetical protein [candidate division KSB1 bacterium]
MKIEQATSAIVSQLWAEVLPQVREAQHLEEAAQTLAETLHSQFSDSVVVARVFLTVPFGDLPKTNKEFVQNLAESAGAADALKADTPVLSLIGTHGQEKDWCDRRKSKGHVGIPLISADFVGAIPMISRLLKEFGVPMDFLDSHDPDVLIETIGQKTGLFFVEDAAKATDAQGRKIIAAQDFVSDHNVKSVFGIGGAYDNGELFVNVVFCRDAFSRNTAEHFLTLASMFQNQTNGLVSSGRIFANG